MKQGSWPFLFFACFGLIIAWAINTPSHAAGLEDLLQEYEAEYSISWMGVSVASSVHQLRALPNGQYFFEAEAEPFLTLLPYDYYESSLFSPSKTSITALKYVYDNQEGSRQKQGKLVFNWSAKQVSDHLPDNPWKETISLGTQDKYTHTLLLRHDLMIGKKALVYSVVDGHEIKTYTYEIVGTEDLETELGTFTTTKIQLVSGNRTTVLWMAKDLNYLLVKLIQYRKGKKLLQGDIQRYEVMK